MGEQNNIRVIFTDKADALLSDVLKKYNLQDSIVEANQLIKKFARGDISEKDLINSLQSELKTSQQTAEKLSGEVIKSIVPLLIKAPEEKFDDPIFREEISKKVFSEQPKNANAAVSERIDVKNLPKINVKEVNVDEVVEKPETTAQPPKKAKRPISSLKQSIPQIKQTSGPDSYREPIE
jgi:hypothetical protein